MVEIELNLFNSLTLGLLDREKDAYAMCYNGSSVLMLPRVARAIETGYSILTSRLWCGPILRDGPNKVRHLSYTDKAFGLRVLPSYAKCLEEELKTDVDKTRGCLIGRWSSGSLPCPKNHNGNPQVQAPSRWSKSQEIGGRIPA